MNNDEYKHLTEMMNTWDSNLADETVTTPFNAEGLLTVSELNFFEKGNTSYKATLGRGKLRNQWKKIR